MDVQMCDITLCYDPSMTKEDVSFGTLVELVVASQLGKPTILVTTNPALLSHPLVTVHAGWILSTLDEAVDLIVGLLGDYS
jgi:hypothetical protein